MERWIREDEEQSGKDWKGMEQSSWQDGNNILLTKVK